MNKKEKYIYDRFINSINVNSSFGKIVERINIKKVVLNKKIKTYKYFKMLIEFSFVLVFACIFALSIDEKSNNIDSALSIAETATNESIQTDDSRCIIVLNNEKYELSIITNENYNFDVTAIESAFTFNNQEYYILKRSNNTLILYKKSDNIFYLATKIN